MCRFTKLRGVHVDSVKKLYWYGADMESAQSSSFEGISGIRTSARALEAWPYQMRHYLTAGPRCWDWIRGEDFERRSPHSATEELDRKQRSRAVLGPGQLITDAIFNASCS